MVVLWWSLLGFGAGWLADRVARFFAEHMEVEAQPVKARYSPLFGKEWRVATMGLLLIWGVASLIVNELTWQIQVFFLAWTWVGWVACLLDWRYRLLPIEALFITVWAVILIQLHLGVSVFGLAGGVLVGGGIPLLLAVFSRGKLMGWADPLVGAFFGAVLSWPFAAFFMEGAFRLGGAWSFALWMRNRRLHRLTLPFVPCLFFSAWITFLGSHILSFSRVFLG